MKWEMDADGIEAVLEKIWDLHDKLSDAIHSVSRAHFLTSVKNPPRKQPDGFYKMKPGDAEPEDKPAPGFVFVKGFRVDEDEPAVQEAKSLYAIRTALEHLEDQLEFFHTVQTQQRAERDAAIARLEQSRIILAMRLAEHQGKKYKVIEEAHALVGDVREASKFSSSEQGYGSSAYPTGDSFPEKRSNALVSFFLSSFNLVSKTLRLDHTVGIMGNAALLAISMVAFVQLNRVGSKDTSSFGRKVSHSSHGSSTRLDVKLAKG